jgi:hypothetical protein
MTRRDVASGHAPKELGVQQLRRRQPRTGKIAGRLPFSPLG